MITNPDGSRTILDLDGSVYMTLPPAVPSPSNIPGWRVRIIANGSHSSACPGRMGTRSSVEVDVMSERELHSLVHRMAMDYGTASVSAVRMGRGVQAFRWAWEARVGGHRLSDVIIATKIQ